MGEKGPELSSGVCSAVPSWAVGSIGPVIPHPAHRFGVRGEAPGKAISPPALRRA